MSTRTEHIREDVAVSAMPGGTVRETGEGITTRVRLNTVVDTVVPGLTPRIA